MGLESLEIRVINPNSGAGGPGEAHNLLGRGNCPQEFRPEGNTNTSGLEGTVKSALSFCEHILQAVFDNAQIGPSSHLQIVRSNAWLVWTLNFSTGTMFWLSPVRNLSNTRACLTLQ